MVFLDQADDAIALVRQAGHGKEGRLRLAYAKGSDRGAPATVVDRFRVERPGVELTRRRQLAGAQGTCGLADDLRGTSPASAMDRDGIGHCLPRTPDPC